MMAIRNLCHASSDFVWCIYLGKNYDIIIRLIYIVKHWSFECCGALLLKNVLYNRSFIGYYVH